MNNLPVASLAEKKNTPLELFPKTPVGIYKNIDPQPNLEPDFKIHKKSVDTF